jgi:single-strand DNA-binding protein
MNKVILLGRLTQDPETRFTQNNTPMTRFKIAVNRQGKDAGADFFTLTAWRTTAEFVGKYMRKGQQVLIEGYLRNNSWTDQQGNKRYADEIHVEKVYFADSKRDRVDDTGDGYSTVSQYQDPPLNLTEDEEDLLF